MSPQLKFALRFIVGCILLIVITHRYGEVLLVKLLPIYQWEISTMEDHYQIESLGLDNEGADRVIRLNISLAKPIFMGNQFLFLHDQGYANASTSTGHAWLASIIMLAMLIAWPVLDWKTYMLRTIFAVPCIAILSMVDIPFTLLAALWDVIIQHISPDTFSPLILWNRFLEGGGRLAMGLFIAALIISATQRIRD